MESLNFTEATLNSSSTGYTHHASSRLLPAVVLSLCFLFGVPGNIAVMVLKPNRQHMSSLSLSLMLNLAASDLLCLLPVPLWIYILLNSWTGGLLACKLLIYLMTCSIYCSLLTVMALSVQRYLQVVHRKKLLKIGGGRRLVALLWLAAIVLSIPALVVRQTITDENLTKCQSVYSSQAQKVVILLVDSLLDLASVSAVAYANFMIHRKIEQATFFNNPQTNRLITSIIVTFLVFWMPYLIINLLDLLASVLQNENLMKFCTDNWHSIGALTLVNSSLNPLLYAFASRNICGGCFKSGHKSSCLSESSATQEGENESSL